MTQFHIPENFEFLDWLFLKAAGCGGKEEKYPPAPGMELDCPVARHHTNCELFDSYIILSSLSSCY
jgi:hypothetical protein